MPNRSRRWPLPRPQRDRTPPLPHDGRLSWLLTAALGVVTLASRLWGISYPSDKLFDEAYYPPEAHELLTWGFEYNRGYTFIVHPPLGKWLIALGIKVFGDDSFGWRFPSAVAGTIAVVVLVRLARVTTPRAAVSSHDSRPSSGSGGVRSRCGRGSGQRRERFGTSGSRAGGTRPSGASTAMPSGYVEGRSAQA